VVLVPLAVASALVPDPVKRERLAPRADWQRKVEAIGFDWHTSTEANGQKTPYWDESACWVLTPEEVDIIEAATNQLHGMVLEAVDRVVRDGLYQAIGYPDSVADLVEASWRRRETTDSGIYGRFDFAFTGLSRGTEVPKLLEYNADTPTGLYEAAVVQWHWLQDTHPEGDQFNSVHEALVAAWAKHLPPTESSVATLHLTSLAPHPEDEGTTRYMQDVAMEAGYATKMIAAADLGWSASPDGNPADSFFVDLSDERVRMLYKLLPWDWALSDPFGDNLASAALAGSLNIVEPAWKLVASSKGLLPVLWEMFPGHPNLLETHFDRSLFRENTDVFAKPKLGREGANVSMATLGQKGAIKGQPHYIVDGPYGKEGYIYQAAAPLARVDGKDLNGGLCTHFAVIGSWVIGGESRGIGIREDYSPITRNTSRFVPHRME
jgi:glutathionylspermidine synthase